MALPSSIGLRLDLLTRTVFNDSSRTVPKRSGEDFIRDVECVSSVPLQMSLYFNAFYFPFWCICYVVMLQLKYFLLPDYYKFILVTLLILMSVIEVIRLFLGYSGNLQGKVPELAGFWLLSILLQLPLLLFLLCDPGLVLLPLEVAAHGILTVFLVFQIPISSFTLRRATRLLAGKFHQLENLERHA
ncbi:transmembrane protein 17A-like [Rhinophrynus dorsalis]